MRNLYSFACDSQWENLQCSCRKYTKGPLRLQGAICGRILTRQEPPDHARKIRTISLKPLVRLACFGRGPSRPLHERGNRAEQGHALLSPIRFLARLPVRAPIRRSPAYAPMLNKGPMPRHPSIEPPHTPTFCAWGPILAVAPRNCVRGLLRDAFGATGYSLSIEDGRIGPTQLVRDALEEVPNAKRWSNRRNRGPERNFLD